MRFSTVALSALAAITPLAAAGVGKAKVTNNCEDPVYLWSVGSGVGDMQTIDPESTYKEKFHHDDGSGGIALKITRTPEGLYDGSPQQVYAYTLTGGARVFYDLSTVFGNPFEGSALLVRSDDGGCGEIYWPDGTPPAGSQVNDCGAEFDVTLTLCHSEE